MMRAFFVVLAAGALAACETMPEFMAQPTGAAANTTATSMTAASSSTTAYAPPPDQQLLELERQLSALAQEQGLGGALASVIDPGEGIVVRPGVTLSGAEAIQAGLTPPANAGPIYWQPDRVHVARGGDMGVTSGRYVQVIRGGEAVQGRYVVVWRRDEGGQWRILTETRIPDPARAPPPRRR